MSLATRQLHLKRINRVRLMAFFTLLFFLIACVLVVENLLISTLIGFVIAYLLGPIVNHFERRGVDRLWSTLWTFFVFGSLIIVAGVFIFPNLSTALVGLQQETPSYISGFSKLISSLETQARGLFGSWFSMDLNEWVEERLTLGMASFFNHIPGFIKQLLMVMLLGPFIAFFMVKDGRKILRQLLALIPNHIFETALSLQHQINIQIGYFVRARLLEAGIVGAVTWAGLMIIGFPFSLLLAIFAAITNLIPYIGPLIGLIPALTIALVNSSSNFELLLLFLVYLIAQLIDAGLLIPFFVARIVNLHPLTVIIVIIAGAQFMGVLGMIISIPLASTLKVTVETLYRHLTESRL